MNLADLDAAIVAHVHNITVDGFPRPAELADVPAGAGWQGEPGSSAFAPYLRVDPTDANRRDLRLANPHSLHLCEWVVKGVSVTAREAKAITDAARTALTESSLSGVPSGLVITMTRHVGTSGPYRDDDTIPELFVSACTVEMAVYKE